MSTSTLPPNATDFEKSMESTIDRGISVDAINGLWSINTCPVELLPWLAWSLSIEYWDDNWSENIKRQIIAQSVSVHKRKGTVGAVKDALKAVGIDGVITEWFQRSDMSPGEFVISVEASHPNLNDIFRQKSIRKQIDNAKRASAHYVIEAGAKAELQRHSIVGGVALVSDQSNLSVRQPLPDCVSSTAIAILGSFSEAVLPPVKQAITQINMICAALFSNQDMLIRPRATVSIAST